MTKSLVFTALFQTPIFTRTMRNKQYICHGLEADGLPIAGREKHAEDLTLV